MSKSEQRFLAKFLIKASESTIGGTMGVLMANKTWVFERLRHSLELLAAPPEVQYRAGELYLNFDHWRMKILGNFPSELGAEQRACLECLQQIFVQMGQDCWTDGGVATTAEWRHVRQLSTQALQAFGWIDSPPKRLAAFAGTRTTTE